MVEDWERYSRVRADVMGRVGRQIRELAAAGLSPSEIEGRLGPGLTDAEYELARLTARHGVDSARQSADGSVRRAADGSI
jgi:hypothetical protein